MDNLGMVTFIGSHPVYVFTTIVQHDREVKKLPTIQAISNRDTEFIRHNAAMTAAITNANVVLKKHVLNDVQLMVMC